MEQTRISFYMEEDINDQFQYELNVVQNLCFHPCHEEILGSMFLLWCVSSTREETERGLTSRHGLVLY